MIDSMSNQRIMIRRHCFGISSLVRENGFAQGAEYFMPSVGDEIPSRCGDCYASQSDLVPHLRSFFSRRPRQAPENGCLSENGPEPALVKRKTPHLRYMCVTRQCGVKFQRGGCCATGCRRRSCSTLRLRSQLRYGTAADDFRARRTRTARGSTRPPG
jgi:hypothetical protein